MPKSELFENFPLQMISYDDLQQILDEADVPLPEEAAEAAEDWGKLCGYVRQAVRDAYLLGAVARDKWLPLMDGEWRRIAEARAEGIVTELRAAYVQFLDRIYGATYRHVLRRAPTALLCSTGQFYLSRLLFYRYPRVRDAGKPPLQEVMELFYDGSELRLELEFSWKPLGEQAEGERPWRRRMNE